jgi:WD40 repeat protein
LLAVGGADGRLRFWKLGETAERRGLANLGAEVTQLAWHPSGRSLAAETTTGTIAVFSTP